MTKSNIKRRHNKTLDLSSVKRYRPLSRNTFDAGGITVPGLVGSFGSDGPSGLQKMNIMSANAAKDAFSSVGSGLSSTGSILSGVTGIVDSALKNAQIADTTGIENSIGETQNADFSNASDTTSLLDSWNSINWQNADYTMNDVRGVSIGEMIGNTISAVGQGAMSGAQVAGPWGAIGGAAAGLLGSGAGIFAGYSKAKKKAAELNERANIANQAATNNFDYTAENLEKQQYKDMLANVAKDGGKIHIKPSKRGTFTAAAKKRGKGVQEFARQVLANKDNYSSAMVKKANFARNFGGRKKDDGGDLNLSLGEGFLYDYNQDYIEPSRISDTSLSERQNNTEGYMEGYTPKNTPISGLFGNKGKKWAELGWSLGELVPIVGNIMGIADVYNDIRNLANDRNIDSGDIGNLLLDISGLVPGVSTLTKGAKLAKLAKFNKAALRLEKLGENLNYATSDGVKDIKKAISDIKDFSNKATIASKESRYSDRLMNKIEAAGREREYKRMVNGLLDGVDRALNPRLVKYYTLQQSGKYADSANDFFNFTGNVEDTVKENEKAMGGSLTHGGNFTNGVTLVNKGGTHEQNPFEGVQMGVDTQGIPNLVEEGEVIFNDYVFSNRLHPSEKELEEANLPKRYKGHTFALIAEDMGKESSERPNDPISRRGLEDSMMKLAMIQEAQRARKGKKGTQKLMAYGGRKYAGDTDFDNPYNDPYIGSKEQALEEAELNYYASKSPEIQEGLRQIRSNNQASDPLPTWMRYMPAAGSAIGAIQSIFQKPDYENADILMQEARDLSRPSVRYRALNNYLTYRPLDRNYYLNQLKGQAGAIRRGIMNSGSNAGNVMAGLLAADYNAQNAVGNTLMKMEQYNDAQRQRVAEFNRGTDQYNSQAAMSADAQNAQLAQNRDRLRSSLMTQAAQMREAADTALEATRSANLTNFFDNMGGIGQDNMAQNWRNRLIDVGYFGAGSDRVVRKNGGRMLTKKNRRRK